jgi:putative heme-binding domain-containing protein
MAELPKGKAPGLRQAIFDTLWRNERPSPEVMDALLIAAASHAPEYLASEQTTLINGSLSPTHPNFPALIRLIDRVAYHFAATCTEAELNDVLKALPKNREPAAVAATVNGLAAGWRDGKQVKLSDDATKAVHLMLKARPGAPPGGLSEWYLPANTKSRLLKLASTWGVKGLDEQLAAITKAAFATLADAKATDADRVAAAQQVVEFQPDSDEAAAKLLAAVTADASPTLASGVFEALSESKAKNVGAAVVAKLKDLPPAARPAALRLVLAKTDSARAFLDAVEKGTLRFDMLALDQRQALATHPDQQIRTRARKILELGGGLPNADRQKVIDELKEALLKGGSVENGKKMFAQHCAKCHKHGAEGTAIGPDLTGFGVHPKEEMVIAILDPSRSVEGNFKLYRVQTADDRAVLGILGAQTGTSVEIIDSEAKRHALAKSDIVSMKETDKSLMPEGFEKVMKPQELADLLEFLAQKGKFVPLPLDKVATVVSTKDMFFDRGGTTERMIFPDWKPKVFEGVPFVLVDPQKDTVKNAVMLNGPQGVVPPKMPKSVSLPFNGKAKAIHLLSGVSGWGALDANAPKTVSMIVRLTYDDGKTEEHELKNGVHFADYIRRVDVPGSKFAFALRGQQLRYLAVSPKRPDAVVRTIELVKGPDRTAPIVMAVTVESP